MLIVLEKLWYVNDKSVALEGVGDFFKTLAKVLQKHWKCCVQIWCEIAGRPAEIGAKIGSAFVSRNYEGASSTIPEVTTFYHSVKGLCLGKNV